MINPTAVEKILLGWMYALAYVTMMAIGWTVAANVGLGLVLASVVLGWWRRSRETKRIERINSEHQARMIEQTVEPGGTADVAIMKLRQSLVRQLHLARERDRWQHIAMRLAHDDGQRHRGLSSEDWDLLVDTARSAKRIALERGGAHRVQREPSTQRIMKIPATRELPPGKKERPILPPRLGERWDIT